MSDMHFGADKWNTLPFSYVLDSFVDFLGNIREPKTLIVSGDITYQGSPRGYEIAARFFDELIPKTGLDRKRIVLCPGNHDIMREKAFSGFDAFSYGVRRDNVCTFEKNDCSAVILDDAYFLVLNSSFHRDYKYG